MKLIVHGIKETFTVSNFSVTATEMQIESEQLLAAILASVEEEVPAPPPAPAPAPQVELVEVPEKLGSFTVDQMVESGWSKEQLIAHGYLKEVIVGSPAEPAPETFEFEHQGNKYKMSAKASGNSLENCTSKGWSIQDVIDQGFAELAEKPEAPTEFPYRNGSNEWVDSAGVIFDEEKHSMTKKGVPGVTSKGLFKKRRGYKGDKEDVTDPNATQAAQDVAPPPAAPVAPAPTNEAPAAPVAPSAPSAPSVGDEEIDGELEDIIKNWN